MRTVKRRKYLKTLGTGTAGMVGSSGIISATQKSAGWEHRMDLYHQARKVLQKTDDVSKFREFLSAHGMPYGKKDIRYNVHRPTSSDGPTTQYLDQADLQIWLTIAQPDCSEYPYRYTGELTIDWSWQGADDWGAPPDDAMGITFSDRHFWIPDLDGDEYWSDSYLYNSNQSSTGIGFGVDDNGADTAGKISAGAQLRWNQATDETANQRFLYGQYTHAYDDPEASWAALGFSVGGFTISWQTSFDGGEWSTDKDHNDVPLKVSAADADCILY